MNPESAVACGGLTEGDEDSFKDCSEGFLLGVGSGSVRGPAG